MAGYVLVVDEVVSQGLNLMLGDQRQPLLFSCCGSGYTGLVGWSRASFATVVLITSGR